MPGHDKELKFKIWIDKDCSCIRCVISNSKLSILEATDLVLELQSSIRDLKASEKEGLCLHLHKTHFEDWPDGGRIEVCDECGLSRHHWEQGEGSWQWIEDIPRARREVEQALKELAGAIEKWPFIPGGKV